MGKTLWVVVFSTCFLPVFSSCQNKSYPLNPGAPSFTLLFPPLFFQWGSEGSGNGQFDNPVDVAVDSSGNVYVADDQNYRIEKFDSNGNYLTQWQDEAEGQKYTTCGPAAVAVDSSGNVYATNDCSEQVEKFNSYGNSLTQWGGGGTGNGQFSSPQGIAVDSAGNVYVADAGNYRIEKFNSNGNYLTKWGSEGTDSGQFRSPIGVAVDSLINVYVVDSSNNRVEKFNSNGNYLAQWGNSGTGNGQFNTPLGVAADPWGNIYVTDYGNNRLEKFDSNGNYLAQWGSQGTGPEQFSDPRGAAADSSGDLYVADSGNNRIQKITLPPVFNALNPGNLKVYPNPVQGGEDLQFAFVLNASAGFSITVKDETGNEVMQYQGPGESGENLLQWNGVPTTAGYSMSYGSYYAIFNSGSSASTVGFAYSP